MTRKKVSFAGNAGDLAGILELPDGAPTAVALFAHCFSCGKDVAAGVRIARYLAARGIATLRFDFTGLGDSEGEFRNTTFSSNAADLVSAARYLAQTLRAPDLLVGHSLGGAAVLRAASEIPSARAVVTIGAPFDPAHVTRLFADATETIEREGMARVQVGLTTLEIRRAFLDDVRSVDTRYVGRLRRALLVFHASLDRTVDIDQAEALFHAAKHPKSFVSLDKSDHLLSNKADAEFVASTIAGWLPRQLERSDPASRWESPAAPGEVVVDELNRAFARRVFTATHEWTADEPLHVGGADLGPDPYAQLLAALGTCTSMTIRMVANRKGVALDHVRVRLRHHREHVEDCETCEGDGARTVDVIERELSFEGALSEADRGMLVRIADRCPVHRTLEGALAVRTQVVCSRSARRPAARLARMSLRAQCAMRGMLSKGHLLYGSSPLCVALARMCRCGDKFGRQV